MSGSVILEFTACRVVKTERFERFTSLLQLRHVPLDTAHSPYVIILVVDSDQKQLPEIVLADLLDSCLSSGDAAAGKGHCHRLHGSCTGVCPCGATLCQRRRGVTVSHGRGQALHVQLPQPHQLVQGAKACYVEGGPAGHTLGRRS